MEKTWWIDFSGYCEIKAETEERAINEFWRLIQKDLPLPSNIYEITGIEENDER